jgi:SAM-dependent methyltransferase
MNSNPFYQNLSDQYDRMTRFGARLNSEIERLSAWVQDPPVTTALDVGCGTGLHTLALASLGVDVTGVDPSEAMLERAREHSRTLDRSATFVRGEMTTLGSRFDPVESVWCLGNTLPHLTRQQLPAACGEFKQVLQPHGLLVIEQLNFDRILDTGDRWVGFSGDGQLDFFRFYDILDDQVRFNILTLDRTRETPDTRLDSTLLTPFRVDDIESALASAGFKDIQRYANRDRTAWTPKAKNIVISART